MRDIDEQPVLDDAGPRTRQRGQSCRIGDRTEAAVQDHVPLIGVEQAVTAPSRHDLRAEAFKEAQLRASAKF